MDFARCTEETKNKIVTASENRMTLILSNPMKRVIKKVLVDGCLIDDHRERCDYLFEIDETSSIIYLELKGCGVDKAASQLAATVRHCRTRHKSKTKCCYIIASRVPRSGPKIQVLKKAFMQNHKVPLTVKNRKAEICV